MSGYRGSGNVTSFQDALNGAAGPLDPSKWTQGIIAITPVVAPVSWGSYSLNGTSGVSQFQGTANPNTQLFNYAYPSILQGGVYGKTQFSQIQKQTNTGAANNQWGPMVAFRPSAMPIGYWFRFINAPGPTLDLQRMAQNGNGAPGTSINFATLIATMNGGVVNNGDVMRISVDFTNPSAPVITCKINGVQVGQFTDNAAPLVGGVPGMMSTHHDGQYTFNNYAAGIGT